MVIGEQPLEAPKTGNPVQSCDSCRVKKRRCDLKDGVQRCSSCTKSKSVCQITHVNKPRERKKKKQMETLEDRLKSLEDLIKSSVVATKTQSRDASDALTPISLPSSLSSLDLFSFPADSQLRQSHDHALSSQRSATAVDFTSSVQSSTRGQQSWTAPTSHQPEMPQHGPMPTTIDLKPLTRVRGQKKCSLPPAEGGFFLLQEYLIDFNVAIPIFDRVVIGSLFHDCYEGKCDGSVVNWIALKLVLAIAHRLRSMSPLGVAQNTKNADLYLEECMDDVHQLLLERPSVFLCQCYLAFAVAFSASSNPQPAGMFVTMALRIAQDLRINDGSYTNPTSTTPGDWLQSQRIFWIAYFMDADLSLRAGRVPSLSPELITIDLPSDNTDDNDPSAVGEMRTVNGEFKINFFRLRVELALIQAELMEALAMPDAVRHAAYEADLMLQALALKLEQWRQNWLFRLSVEQLQSLLHRSDLVHVAILESVYFSTLHVLLAQKSPNPRLRTRPFCADALMNQICRPRCEHPHKDARRLIGILRSIPGEDFATYWLTVDPMVAALAVLFSFIVNNPKEDSAMSDFNMAQPLLHTLNQLSNVSKDDDLPGIQNVCVDLYLRAERALQS